MSDDRTIYFKVSHASEKALALILTIQQECERLFIVGFSPELKMTSFSPKEGETTDKEWTMTFCKTLESAKNNIRFTIPGACLDLPGKLFRV